MKLGILCGPLIVAAGLWLHGLPAQADEILFAERLSAQHFIERNLWANPDLQVILAELEYGSDSKVASYRRDFNGDGHIDDLLRAAPSLCGNGGCPYALVDGRTKKTIGRFFAGTLLIGRIRVGGFPVLYGISHVSAEVSNWSCAVFDGNSYAKVVELPLSGAAWNRFHSTIANLPLAAASE